MNLKAIVPLGLAAVLGLVAMFLVRNAIAHRNGAPVASGNTVAVVVAKRDADPGTALTRDDLTVARLPADSAPGQVFSNPDQVVGRVMQTPLVKGQAILETLLAPTNSGHGLAALVPNGMRAVTIEVNEYTGVGGMLEPGCRVDLVSVIRDDKTKEAVAKTVLQNIKVSAIGRSTAAVEPTPGQPLPPPANSVTILCTPTQVQTLQLASMSGRPWLVLRSNRDGEQVELDGTTLSEVLGHSGNAVADSNNAAPVNNTANASTTQPAAVTTVADVTQSPAPAPAPAAKRTVEIIVGGVSTTYTQPVESSTPAQNPAPGEAPTRATTPGSKTMSAETDLGPVTPTGR